MHPIHSPESPSRAGRSDRLPLAVWTGLAALLLLGAQLRWRYLRTISLYVDEFTTLWAAERIQKIGVPRMPSGVLYTRGILASYLEAGFLALFGDTYTVGRLPSLLLGLTTIGVIFWCGKQAWNARVGILAAAGLALLPEAIVWSGRARFYALFQLLALLTAWALFAALTTLEPARERRRLALFALLFWLALFTQEQMILLYPALLLAMLLWRGPRYLLRPWVMAVNLICLGGIAARFLMEKLGQPGYFETIQSTRPYMGLVFDVQGAWQTYAPLLIAPARLPWTIAGLLALGVALVLWGQMRSLEKLPRFHQATLFFALQFGFVFLVMLTLVGTTWRDARYLFFVQPFWLLCGAAGMVWLIDRLLTQENMRWAVTGVTALVLLALFWQPARSTLAQQVEGYDRVFAYVADVRQPGEVVLSPQPPACAQVLGECDYYAIQHGYEEYVIQRDGELIDRWSGAPLLQSAEELTGLLEEAPGVWFVSDSLRLATRYDAAFLRVLIQQFDIAYSERGVLALYAAGPRPAPKMTEERELATPLVLGPLALTGWAYSPPRAGGAFHVTLIWQGAGAIDRQYNTSLRLINEAGGRLAQADGPPARGIIPTTLFFATPLPDPKVLELPADLPPGRYGLEIVVYDVASGEAAGAPQVIEWIDLE
ncbi:MAG: glycosyltransferase family 39 protein [Caldilineaceae bacterium]|nr:glycosyltransferase family 39 protein [Caldilineaceae bacterium]